MKRLGFIITFFLVASTLSAQEWIEQTFDSTLTFYGTHFLNENTGFVCGPKPSIYKTNDGGDSWKELAINKTSDFVSGLQDIFFIDSLIGFAGGESNTLIKTVDGGNTWVSLNTKLAFNFPSRIDKLHFFDSLTGIVIGQSSEVIKTTDGGNSWTKVYTNNGYEPKDMLFINNNIGFITSAKSSGQFGSIIIRTTNAGDTWDTVYKREKQLFGTVSFPTPSIGFVAIPNSGKTGVNLLKTTDGGLNWVEINSVGLTGYTDNIRFTTPNIGFSVSNGNEIYKTTDGGLSWKKNTTKKYLSLQDIIFISDSLGWAVGFDGSIVKYTRRDSIITKTPKISVYTPFRSVNSTDSLNFESIPFGDSSKRVVIIKNIGTDTLLVNYSIPSSYFGVIPNTSASILPNDSFVSSLYFKPDNIDSVFTETITISSNDIGTPTYSINLFGKRALTTSLNKISNDKNSFYIFPNPISKGSFTIGGVDINFNSKIKYSINSSNGKQVVKGTLISPTLNVESLSSGFYTLVLSNENGVLSQKRLIIE